MAAKTFSAVIPDRLSDMVATIICPNIVMYTKRIQDKLEICKEKHLEYIFQEDGLAVNPYIGCEILLLPKDNLIDTKGKIK